MIRRAWYKHRDHDEPCIKLERSDLCIDADYRNGDTDALLSHVDPAEDDRMNDHSHPPASPIRGALLRRAWPCCVLRLRRVLRPARLQEYGSMCSCLSVVSMFLCIVVVSLYQSSVLRQRLLQLGEDSLLRPLLSVEIQSSSVIADTFEHGKYCLAKRGMWKCYDCGDSDDEGVTTVVQRTAEASSATPLPSEMLTTSTRRRRALFKRKRHCRSIEPQGSCMPFLIPRRDAPVRVRHASYDSTSQSVQSTRTLGLRPRFYYHDQPVCATLGDCWDLSRCRGMMPAEHKTPVLTVYLNESTPHHHYLLDYAAQALQQHSRSFRLERVNDHRAACLVLVTPQTYPHHETLESSEHWQYTYVDEQRHRNRHFQYGTNHLLWHTSYFFLNETDTIDLPFPLQWHAGQAALASVALDRSTHRPGYDMVLPLPREWGRNTPPESVRRHQKQHVARKWLLGFRGKVQATPHVYYHHRWLAAEYWAREKDVIVDVKCQREKLPSGKKYVEKDYDNRVSYSNVLWNTTFGFAPGGSGVGSFRFGEILSTGGIPVVMPEYVPPFSPEVDWSECLIVTSEARIIDLPRTLRKITSTEIQERRAACWKLLQATMGDTKTGMTLGRQRTSGAWHDDERVTFTLAMEIWAARIVNALTMEKHVQTILG